MSNPIRFLTPGPAPNVSRRYTLGNIVTHTLTCPSMYKGVAVLLLAALVSACATYRPAGPESVALMERAETQVQGDVRVTAAVPSREETETIFVLPLYDRGVQPVWLKIRNDSPQRVRLALVSIDPDYFSPMEVAYTHRGGYSKKGKADMERYIHAQGIQRFIPSGATVSGFVFTHLDPGTKGFNVDIYGNDKDYIFTFFISVPGFVPDHAEVNFAALYGDSELIQLQKENELRELLADWPCCSVDKEGKQGDPFNLVIVSEPEVMGRALLRSGWVETAAGAVETAAARAHLYRGRRPDVTAHKVRKDGSERKELRLWLTPVRLGEALVWLGQSSHDISRNIGEDAFSRYRIDPDLDDARMYVLQDFWYSQSLLKFGFVNGKMAADIGSPAVNFQGSEYFTDGFRSVLILSGRPVSLDETQNLWWDRVPGL